MASPTGSGMVSRTVSAGDWLVNNGGDVYTVERETFERTYRMVSPGVYVKIQPVWARVADEDGKIQTKEGETHYEAGDMIVFNDAEERGRVCNDRRDVREIIRTRKLGLCLPFIGIVRSPGRELAVPWRL